MNRVESEREKLQKAIANTFNLEELRTLSFDLDIGWEVQNSSIRENSINLIEFCRRRRQQTLLKQYLIEKRPNENWDDINWAEIFPPVAGSQPKADTTHQLQQKHDQPSELSSNLNKKYYSSNLFKLTLIGLCWVVPINFLFQNFGSSTIWLNFFLSLILIIPAFYMYLQLDFREQSNQSMQDNIVDNRQTGVFKVGPRGFFESSALVLFEDGEEKERWSSNNNKFAESPNKTKFIAWDYRKNHARIVIVNADGSNLTPYSVEPNTDDSMIQNLVFDNDNNSFSFEFKSNWDRQERSLGRGKIKESGIYKVELDEFNRIINIWTKT